MIQFDIITVLPNYFIPLTSESILAKAQTKGLIDVRVHNLRNWAIDKRGTVDDRPFGGNPGMLLMLEPLYKALKDLGVYPHRDQSTKVILTSARGETWNQAKAVEFAQDLKRIVLICGRYEGVDFRVAEHMIDAEISIGDYVLTGGELAAGVIVDSVARLLPGVLGNADSLLEESHSANDLDQKEYPQYTRPQNFITAEGESWLVPEILISGHHAQIKQWQESQKNRLEDIQPE